MYLKIMPTYALYKPSYWHNGSSNISKDVAAA
jgi:hypothetical protein